MYKLSAKCHFGIAGTGKSTPQDLSTPQGCVWYIVVSPTVPCSWESESREKSNSAFETLDIIDTLLPTTPTKHFTAWRSGDGGEGAVRVNLAVCRAPGGCARAAGIRVIGVWEAAHH